MCAQRSVDLLAPRDFARHAEQLPVLRIFAEELDVPPLELRERDRAVLADFAPRGMTELRIHPVEDRDEDLGLVLEVPIEEAVTHTGLGVDVDDASRFVTKLPEHLGRRIEHAFARCLPFGGRRQRLLGLAVWILHHRHPLDSIRSMSFRLALIVR